MKNLKKWTLISVLKHPQLKPLGGPNSAGKRTVGRHSFSGTRPRTWDGLMIMGYKVTALIPHYFNYRTAQVLVLDHRAKAAARSSNTPRALLPLWSPCHAWFSKAHHIRALGFLYGKKHCLQVLFQIVDDLMSPWAMVPIRDLQDILPGAMGQTDLTFNPVSLLNSQAWGLEMPILQGTEAPRGTHYSPQQPRMQMWVLLSFSLTQTYVIECCSLAY